MRAPNGSLISVYCDDNAFDITLPSYVHNDYYCELTGPKNGYVFTDILWDGPGIEVNCCTSPKMPWF